VNLDGVRSIFQLIRLPLNLIGQLARLPDRHETDAQVVSQRCPDYESASLDAGDVRRLDRPVLVGEDIYDEAERFGVLDKGCQVLEDDPRFGKVRDIADLAFEPVNPGFS